ncbi:MAG: ABC transporter substrate-binding protein [Candidatus Atabeyarchaeum deiterrae]
MKQLRIGHLSTAYHTAFVLMGGEWVENRMNVDVSWRIFGTGPEMIKAFIRGELDIAYIGLPPTMIGISKGLAVKCVAGGHVEGTILTATSDFIPLNEVGTVSGVLRQFKGKAIGTPTKGSIHDVIIRRLVSQAGLQGDVEIKNFPWTDFVLEAMEEKTVHGGCGTPQLAILCAIFLKARMILPPEVMWPYNPSYGIVATSETIRNSSKMLEDFLLLHEEASNLIREKPEEAARMASKAIGIVSKDFLLEVFKVSPKYCASLPEEYVKSTLSFVPVLKEMGYISKPLSKSDVFQTEIIDRIHKEKPHYSDPGTLR